MKAFSMHPNAQAYSIGLPPVFLAQRTQVAFFRSVIGIRSVLGFVVLILGASSALAVDTTWTGAASDRSWFSADNWSSQIPQAGDTVNINANTTSANPACIGLGTAACRSLSIASSSGNTGNLRIDGGDLAVGLTLNLGTQGTGRLDCATGSLTAGSISVHQITVGGATTSRGIFEVSGAFSILAQKLVVKQNGTLRVHGSGAGSISLDSLVFEAGSTLEIELDAFGVLPIQVTGDVTISEDACLKLSLRPDIVLGEFQLIGCGGIFSGAFGSVEVADGLRLWDDGWNLFVSIPPPVATQIIVGYPNEYSCPAATNAIPHAESFETYDDGALLNESSGWSSGEGDESIVSAEAYAYDAVRPIDTTQSQILRLDTQGNHLFHSVTGSQEHVWVDMMVRFSGSDTEPWIYDQDATQLILYPQLVLNDYNTVLFSRLCAYARTNSLSEAVFVAAESDLDLMAWHRLTLHLAYPKESGDAFFAVALDLETLQWPGGELLPGEPSPTGKGAWLRCASLSQGRLFPGLAFNGCGRLDDLVVTDQYRGPKTDATVDIKQAVAISWNSDYGRSYRVDYCTDLAAADWQPLADKIVGEGRSERVYDQIQDIPRRFYRVVPLEP